MNKFLGWILPLIFVITGCGSSDFNGSNGGVLHGGLVVTIPNGISWTPPTLHSDGSLFTDLSKYRLYYGSNINTLKAVLDIDSEGVAITSYTFSTAEIQVLANLASGNSAHFFALTAIDIQNVESMFSNIAEIL